MAKSILKLSLAILSALPLLAQAKNENAQIRFMNCETVVKENLPPSVTEAFFSVRGYLNSDFDYKKATLAIDASYKNDLGKKDGEGFLVKDLDVSSDQDPKALTVSIDDNIFEITLNRAEKKLTLKTEEGKPLTISCQLLGQ